LIILKIVNATLGIGGWAIAPLPPPPATCLALCKQMSRQNHVAYRANITFQMTLLLAKHQYDWTYFSTQGAWLPHSCAKRIQAK